MDSTVFVNVGRNRNSQVKQCNVQPTTRGNQFFLNNAMHNSQQCKLQNPHKSVEIVGASEVIYFARFQTPQVSTGSRPNTICDARGRPLS